MNSLKHTFLLAVAMIWLGNIALGQKSCCEPGNAETSVKIGDVTISDVSLLNQEGETVKFHELVKDKVVAMNFIFTTCKTICPPMGANFAQLKKRMEDHVGKDLAMISISIDPQNDTPERLKAWSENFSAGPGWTLLTGDKATVDQLLKDLKVFTPLKEEHAPIILMGKESGGDWIRTNGLAAPDKLASQLEKYFAVEEPLDAKGRQDQSYFTDTYLVNQHGESFRLYSDLMRGKVVVINPFFAECPGSCPAMHTTLKEVQRHLGEKMGKEVVILSITVDPLTDTPEKLATYAEQFEAGAGWHFLSGKVQNVQVVLKKLGKYVENREAHDTIFLMGNMDTGLWKKANGLAAPGDIIEVLNSVIEDKL